VDANAAASAFKKVRGVAIVGISLLFLASPALAG